MPSQQPATSTSRRRSRRAAASHTAAALDARSGDGWWVLHGAAVPGVDHLVVTPAAVWVVASSGTGGAPTIGELEAIRVGATEVTRALATSPTGLLAPVRAVLVSSAAQWSAAAYVARGVSVVGTGTLVRLLHREAAVFTPDEVDHLADVVDEAFPNRRGAPTSVVRPAPSPPASPELPVLHPSGQICTGTPKLVRQPETVIGLMLASSGTLQRTGRVRQALRRAALLAVLVATIAAGIVVLHSSALFG